jgi:lytic murein transglycosylase
MRRLALSAALGSAVLTGAAPAIAAQCNPSGGFNAFLAEFKQEAARAGISPRGLAALEGLTLDPAVLAADRRQHVFSQSFEQFSGRMISKDRLVKGAYNMQRYASMLQRIEQRFGVQGAVLVAIWGLETDYGVVHGKRSVVRSVATLAFDCRRSELFQRHLADALRIIDAGDMTATQMVGEWAGEIGQTQFLPSSYYKYAVDFDGDGRRDLVNSVPDVLASTANYLNGHGWQRGQGWGPGEPNFEVIKSWNKADIYARTIALFAQKLDGDATRPEQPRPRAALPARDDRRARR